MVKFLTENQAVQHLCRNRGTTFLSANKETKRHTTRVAETDKKPCMETAHDGSGNVALLFYTEGKESLCSIVAKFSSLNRCVILANQDP